MSLNELAEVPEGVNVLEYLHTQHKERESRLFPSRAKQPTRAPDELAVELDRAKSLRIAAEAALKVALIEEEEARADGFLMQAAMLKGRSNLRAIIRLTGFRFGYTYLEMMSHRRVDPLVRARQAAMWLLKEMTDKSLPEIGRALNRDHTTILHGVRRVEELMATDPVYAEKVMSIKADLRAATESAGGGEDE